MKLWMKNFFYTILLLLLVTSFSLIFLYFVMPKYYQMRQTSIVTDEVEKLAEKCEGLPLSQVKAKIKKYNLQKIEDKSNTFIDAKGESSTKKDKIVITDKSQNFTDGLNFLLLDQNQNTVYSGEVQNEVYTYFAESPTEEEQEKVRAGLEEFFRDSLIKRAFKDDQKNTYFIGVLLASQPITDASRILLELSPIILLFALVVGSVAALFYSRSSTKRIRELSTTANKMMNLDSKIHCDEEGKDEIALLAKDINQLNQNLVSTIDALEGEILKVEEVERSKAYFVQSASHELKTPVTIMSGLVEGMLLNIGRYQDRDKYLAVCQDLLDKQSYLIKEIAAIYQVEMFDENKDQCMVRLDLLIKEIINPYRLLSERTDKQFDLQLQASQLYGNETDIKRILSNIIGNAYHYSSEVGRITIRLKDTQVQVENECVPLKAEVLQKVFEPFYRPDYARSRKDGGTGLGLFIVKKIAEKNGYLYTFEPSKKHNSMIFTIDFTSRYE